MLVCGVKAAQPIDPGHERRKVCHRQGPSPDEAAIGIWIYFVAFLFQQLQTLSARRATVAYDRPQAIATQYSRLSNQDTTLGRTKELTTVLHVA